MPTNTTSPAQALSFAHGRVTGIERELLDLDRRRKYIDDREAELKVSLDLWQKAVADLEKTAGPALPAHAVASAETPLTDACYEVLRSAARGMHAKEIAEELKNRGRQFRAKNPLDSVHKMMQRDRRFYRPGNRGSFWELEEWRSPEEPHGEKK